MAAGATLVYLGAQLMAKKWQMIKEALPGLSFGQLAQLVGACMLAWAGLTVFISSLIEKSRLMHFPLQQASMLFGVANFVTWFKMVQVDSILWHIRDSAHTQACRTGTLLCASKTLLQAGAPWNEARFGQLIKICASSSLMTGNALGLGWQHIKLPGEKRWSMLALISAAALANPTASA